MGFRRHKGAIILAAAVVAAAACNPQELARRAGARTRLSIAARMLRAAGSPPGIPADVAVVGVANLLAVHRDMPEQLAYDITRLLFDDGPSCSGACRGRLG